MQWATFGSGLESTMRKPVMPSLENRDDLARGSVPKWKYQIPENTPDEVAAVRRPCPDDVLHILGMTQ